MSLQQELHEAKHSLLEYLGIDAPGEFPLLNTMAEGQSKFIRDIKVNLKNSLRSAHLNAKETALIALAVAVSERNSRLTEAFTARARSEGANDEDIAETFAMTSLLSTNNVFYRFRHMAHNKRYETLNARIKMSIMLSPTLGKEFFELASLVVSAVNGCESCINAHEESVRELGASEERIFDAIRLGSVVKGASVLIH